MTYTRRELLQHALITTAALSPAFAKKDKGLPDPNKSGIDHIVVAMMENRSFDHFLGWLPGADGRQAGLTYFDAANMPHATYHLTDYQGCGHSDPDHSYDGGRVEWNNGACDGWMRAGQNDEFAIGYYTASDLPFFTRAAPDWIACDRFFAAIMAETFPNRFYQHAAQTDRITNILDLSTLPTIWDRLSSNGNSARYYYSDVPFLALWGLQYLPISDNISSFYSAAAAGQLPQVSFVEPSFLGAAQGLSADDHPFADIRNGQAFLANVYNAIVSSPTWPRTVLVISYDEWGGFFDHVSPSEAQDPVPAHQLRGFRVPALVISPWSPNEVAHDLYDHTSVLKMIEWRFNLPPLTVRDATANNLADTLDFDIKTKKLSPPQPYSVPQGPFGGACPVLPLAAAQAPTKWHLLYDRAKQSGWPI